MRLSTKREILILFWIILGLAILFIISKTQKLSQTSQSLSYQQLVTSSIQPALFNRDFSIWLYENKLYHRNNPCGDDFTLIDIDPNNIRFYKEYFSDVKSVWVKNWGYGEESGYCLPPIKLQLNPPVDPATFVEIPGGAILWAKDKFGLIYEYFRVESFTSPFETYDQPYIKKDSVFYYLTNLVKMQIDPIKNLPSDINKFFSIYYATNGLKIYYIDPYSTQTATEIIGADPNNFKNLTASYWTDGSSIYYTYNKLQDAQPGNFQYVGNNYYGNDKHVYVKEKIISNVPYTDFKMIKPVSESDSCGVNYWTDGNTIFYEEKNLGINYAKAHMPTWIWEGPGKCAWISYIWDDQHASYYKKDLTSVDLPTFKVLSRNYARDKNHFYLDGEIMPGDPNMIEKDYNNGEMCKYINCNVENNY